MYDALKSDAHNNIQEIKRTFLENVIAPLSEEEKKEEPGKDKKDDKKGRKRRRRVGEPRISLISQPKVIDF